MKIAMFVPPWIKLPPAGYGGIEVVVSLLTEGLTARGHDVTLFTVGQTETSARLFSVYEEEQRPNLDAPPSDFLHVAATHSLASYLEIREGSFDFVHDHSWGEGLLSAAFLNIPTVHTLHSPLGPSQQRLYGLLKGRQSITFVTISDHQQKSLPGLNYGATVYNGVRLERYPYREEKDDYLFYLGRFNPEKAPHLACEVAKRLGKRLVLAGKVQEEEEHAYFDEFVGPYLGKDIEYVGELGHWSDEKMELLSKAEAYVYPIQWDEPFGITMAEAQACGTPVLTFRRGAAPEVVQHTVTGFVVDTLEELTEAVSRVHEIDPRRCREWVSEQFTADTMVDGYERVYQAVLERDSG